jgi:hypothetical protein
MASSTGFGAAMHIFVHKQEFILHKCPFSKPTPADELHYRSRCRNVPTIYRGNANRDQPSKDQVNLRDQIITEAPSVPWPTVEPRVRELHQKQSCRTHQPDIESALEEERIDFDEKKGIFAGVAGPATTNAAIMQLLLMQLLSTLPLVHRRTLYPKLDHQLCRNQKPPGRSSPTTP